MSLASPHTHRTYREGRLVPFKRTSKCQSTAIHKHNIPVSLGDGVGASSKSRTSLKYLSSNRELTSCYTPHSLETVHNKL